MPIIYIVAARVTPDLRAMVLSVRISMSAHRRADVLHPTRIVITQWAALHVPVTLDMKEIPTPTVQTLMSATWENAA